MNWRLKMDKTIDFNNIYITHCGVMAVTLQRERGH
jgi:hypothetical protein|tara:strand:- start:397 stop:501 length:105 start_codon:yes stop_codon:yes gene_type:complete